MFECVPLNFHTKITKRGGGDIFKKEFVAIQKQITKILFSELDYNYSLL